MGVSSTCWMKRRITLTGKDTTPLIDAYNTHSDFSFYKKLVFLTMT
ncbi:MAG: hypothetical protein ACW98X_25935 [Promethearchaeota archaeon]